MKKGTWYLTLILVILNTMNASGKNRGVRIRGEILNANEAIVQLSYTPRFRGNLNFDGFKGMSAYTDEKGHFVLKSNVVTHTAYHQLVIGNHSLPIVLFEGDDLTIEDDLAKSEAAFFVVGKGAAKINIEQLEQFQFSLHYEESTTISHYKSRIDSVTDLQLDLLNAIRNKDLNNETISSAANKAKIQRIIRRNNLSSEAYEYLRHRILIQKTSLVGFTSYLAEKKPDYLFTEDDWSLFDDFSTLDFNEYFAYKNWYFQNALDFGSSTNF